MTQESQENNYLDEDGYCKAEIDEEDKCGGFDAVRGTCLCRHKSHADKCLSVKLLEAREG